MHKFEECYKRTRSQVRNFQFFPEAAGTAVRLDMVGAMDSDGPDRKGYDQIKALRGAIDAGKRKSNKSEGEIILAGCEDAKSKTLVGAVTGWMYDVNDRVAAVKMLRHLYLVKMRGAQDIWVFSPPKSYSEWLYDEFDGLGRTGLAQWSSEDEETYSESDKTAMADAAGLALTWSMKCVAKLASPDAATQAVVAKWFCEPGADEKTIKKAAKTLLDGFKKITTVLNSNKLVLSDEPVDRKGGGWKDFAFVYKSEKMHVIYVQGATLSAAKGSKMWLAALTIVHELSHREVDTEDHRYDSDGKLAPGGGTGALSADKAIGNADNWGYFAADLNGSLNKGVSTTVSGIA